MYLSITYFYECLFCYLCEKGNIEEAKKWFRLTAEQGDDIHILYDIY